ncbi:hypothetical protein PMAYCL1PPCAC_15528, partial [Pristionchus mayeri]
LLGCAHVIDLLLIRGGILVDWTDQEKSRSIHEMFVCETHRTKLLTNWEWNRYSNKINFKRKLTCSLHEVTHSQKVKPLSFRRLNKFETIRLIEATDRFFHVGTGVCVKHGKAIAEHKFDEISFCDQDKSTEDVDCDVFTNDLEAE